MAKELSQRELMRLLSRSIGVYQVASEFGIAIQTVYRWIETQEDLPVIFMKTGPLRSTPMFPWPEIRDWFDEHEAHRRGPK